MLIETYSKVEIGIFDLYIEKELYEEVQNLYDEIITLAKLRGYDVKYRNLAAGNIEVRVSIPTNNNYVIQFGRKNEVFEKIIVIRSFADVHSNIEYEKDILYSLNIVKRGMLL